MTFLVPHVLVRVLVERSAEVSIGAGVAGHRAGVIANQPCKGLVWLTYVPTLGGAPR